MINKIGVEDTINSKALPSQKQGAQSPNFKGLGFIGLLQICERNPMINVAVIDLLSAILPRTIVESLTNIFAGFEAFRRESSGLIVNCMIPGLISMVLGLGLNNLIMPKGAKMGTCLADSSLIDKTAELYSHATSKNKAEDVIKELFENIEGYDGKNKIQYSKILTAEELKQYTEQFAELTEQDLSNKQLSKRIKAITNEVANKTHVYENVKTQDVKASNIKNLMQDVVKFLHEFGKAKQQNTTLSIEEYATQGKRLVRGKSLGAFAIILPLAASMQYINRKITNKVSGTKGAPIYDDFGKNNSVQSEDKTKEGLLKQKIISISSMLAVGALSLMKKPTWNMFEFKGLFPTMDQARIISTTTFASRMAVADDKNELREATVRDIATFASLYFLGDYAAKGTATIIEKKKGVSLLNDTKPLEKDANIFKKFWHWFKDVNLKSSEEVVSKTAEELKGKELTPEQVKTIEKELKTARNLRSTCQLANLGVSLLLLGLVIPIFTRRNTKKRHAEAMQIAQNSSSNLDSRDKINTVAKRQELATVK